MSSKRAIRRKQCERKKRFFSRVEAQFEANRLWDKMGKLGVRPYLCKFCKGWHNGHMRRGDRLSMGRGRAEQEQKRVSERKVAEALKEIGYSVKVEVN